MRLLTRLRVDVRYRLSLADEQAVRATAFRFHDLNGERTQCADERSAPGGIGLLRWTRGAKDRESQVAYPGVTPIFKRVYSLTSTKVDQRRPKALSLRGRRHE